MSMPGIEKSLAEGGELTTPSSAESGRDAFYAAAVRSFILPSHPLLIVRPLYLSIQDAAIVLCSDNLAAAVGLFPYTPPPGAISAWGEEPCPAGHATYGVLKVEEDHHSAAAATAAATRSLAVSLQLAPCVGRRVREDCVYRITDPSGLVYLARPR
jgi:hypothetical protein